MRIDDGSAIVLAGGRSSRMGRPKALLPFDGQPLIAHLVAALQPLFADIVIVAAPDQELPPLPARVVRDDVPHQGPVGGISYGLRAAAGNVSFVTSCDCVFPNAALIAHLVSTAAGFDVVVPCWEGRLQPLHAVYRTAVAPLLDEQLRAGQLRPVQLFERVRMRRVEAPEIRRFDPDGLGFFNMNTPEDYAEALRRWSERRGRSRPAPVECSVEFLGVARLVARVDAVPLALSEGSTLADVFTALSEKLPVLVGRVIGPDRSSLAEGCACSVNGLTMVRNPSAAINPGDTIVILSADAGG